MIKHIVMFRFQETALERTKEENLLEAKWRLEALTKSVPTLLSAKVEINDEVADQSNYDLVLFTEHEDWKGLDAYQTHPAHLEVAKFIKEVRSERACVDYSI